MAVVKVAGLADLVGADCDSQILRIGRSVSCTL